MSRLVFITHPETAPIPGLRAEIWPFSSKGCAAAARLWKNTFWERIDAVYSSTEGKASVVGSIVSEKFGLSFEQIAELGEIDRSSTPIVPLDEYLKRSKAFYADPDTSMRGWETARQGTRRVDAAVRRIMERHPSGSVAIIGHGMTGTLLRCALQNKEPSFAEDPKKCGCIMEIDWEARSVAPWSVY